MTSYRVAIAAAAAALLTLSAQSAMAFGYRTCSGVPIKWSSNFPSMAASPVSFPTGYWRNGLQRTVDLTNQNPSPFGFNLVTDNGTVGLNNGQNEAWGSSDNGVLQGAPAIAYTPLTCYWFFTIVTHYNEADVIFDYRSPFKWTADELTSSIMSYKGDRRQLQSTGVHELGHGMGLLHENRWYNIMGADFQHIWANGTNARGYFGEDASNGAVFLYGLWSAAYEDLGVAHWRYSGASGEYSTHGKTAIYNTSDVALPWITVNGERTYLVNRGQQVRAEFSYENNGKNTKSVTTGYYISTNNLISRTDRLIATSSMTVSRDIVLTSRRTLTIPSNLTRGATYWLGTVIDTGQVVSDNVPSNNATYIPIRVN
ncbi:MAG TPA: hypothetical protein PKA13_10925 [Geminicoccaceae bacterium]|nr:hypothetical protein [Geminicoccus sp.]HMU50279.1 hypothetical protein [Geminicoccaceae bacterium]